MTNPIPGGYAIRIEALEFCGDHPTTRTNLYLKQTIEGAGEFFSIPEKTITIDGNSDDWNDIQPVFADAVNDQDPDADFDGTDLEKFYLAKDDIYLYTMMTLHDGAPKSDPSTIYFFVANQIAGQADSAGDRQSSASCNNGIWNVTSCERNSDGSILGDHTIYLSSYVGLGQNFIEWKVPLAEMGELNGTFVRAYIHCVGPHIDPPSYNVSDVNNINIQLVSNTIAATHFNPGDRVEAAVTISCPDPGICSCVIPQGTQGTVLCYDAEDAEYPGGYPYFVHWDNGCNTHWDVDSGYFVDYCAKSDDWGVWMTTDEVTSALSSQLKLLLPAGQSAWNYPSAINPVMQTNAATCQPFAAGYLASGNLNLQVGLPAFSSGVDIYLAIGFADALFLIDGSNGLQSTSGLSILPKWKTNISAVIDESLYGNIPTSLLPPGIYNLYMVAVPAGETDFSHYYFWATSFSVGD